MKILMTGKSGLIGSAVFKKLEQDGHSIHSIGRREADYKMDLYCFKPIEGISSCDVFIHCAGITDEEIVRDKMKAIHRGTCETAALLDWAASLKPTKIVYISTAHVYGNLNRTIDEKTTPTPVSLYAILHLFCEQYLQNTGINHLTLRPLTGYGEVCKTFGRWGLIPYSFPKSLATVHKIVIKTHGKQYRNFVSTSTIANIVSREIQSRNSKTINPIGPHNMSIRDFAQYCVETLRSLSEKDFEIIVKHDAEYSNFLNYSSKYEFVDECNTLLQNHIVNIYKQFQKDKVN